MSDRWDRHFLKLALTHSDMSKDPNKRAGAVIVGPDREIRSIGFNGFPRGIEDHWRRLQDRDLKNRWIVHAEQNAILAAARFGASVKGCTIYFTLNDETGPHGGCPCIGCMGAIIQSGIVKIVSYPFKSGSSNWTSNLQESEIMLKESGIKYQEVSLEPPVEDRRVPRRIECSCNAVFVTTGAAQEVGPHHMQACMMYLP